VGFRFVRLENTLRRETRERLGRVRDRVAKLDIRRVASSTARESRVSSRRDARPPYAPRSSAFERRAHPRRRPTAADRSTRRRASRRCATSAAALLHRRRRSETPRDRPDPLVLPRRPRRSLAPAVVPRTPPTPSRANRIPTANAFATHSSTLARESQTFVVPNANSWAVTPRPRRP